MKRYLNLGSGNQVLTGQDGTKYINIDEFPYPEVDIIRDIQRGLPFDDESVDEIFTSHFLEHIKDLNFVMEECYRVLKKEGIMRIVVPHCSTLESIRDPSHVRFFHEQTFHYFTEWGPKEAHFKTKCNFKIIKQMRNSFELWVSLKKE